MVLECKWKRGENKGKVKDGQRGKVKCRRSKGKGKGGEVSKVK